jgi:hypothetical protein
VQYAAVWDVAQDLRHAKLRAWCIASILLGTGFAAGVVLDGGYLMARWIPGTAVPSYEWVALVFALGAPLFAGQVLLLACMRTGGEERAARLQFLFVAFALAAAVIGVATRSVQAYLVTWLLGELAWTALLLAATRDLRMTWPFVRWSGAGLAAVAACFAATQWLHGVAGLGEDGGFALRWAGFAALSVLMAAQLRGQLATLSATRRAHEPAVG